MAQGHTGASNNWWFGGKGMYNVGNHTVVGEDQDGIIGIDALRGGQWCQRGYCWF